MRIRTRLVLLVLVVLLPALIGSAMGGAALYREHQQFSRASLRETARALALALDAELARRAAVLATLAASQSLVQGDLERFDAHARRVAAENDAAIILSDLEGRQLMNTRRPPGAVLPSMLPQEREARARSGNEATLVSDLYLPPAGLGPYSFAIQVPVRRDGRVVQFLTMGTFSRQLQGLLAQQRLPAGWHATIVDRQGRVAARSVEPEQFVGQLVRPELMAAMQAAAEGSHAGMTLAGRLGTAFFSRAPESQWAFIISVPDTTLQGSGAQAAALLAVASLLLLAIGVVAAVLMARRITQPVEALREAAERLGRNKPVPARRFGTVELDAVHAALAQAGERLRSASGELERQVADAVARAEESQRSLLQGQKLEALGRLTGGIAHDFNNVLQTLTAGLDAAHRRAPAELRELLARCQRAVVRGTELARQLMVFGRVQEVRAQTIDLARRLDEALPLLEGALPSSIRLDVSLERGLWPLTVDAAQLELALLNLLMNARDAMPSGGRIEVRGRNRTLARPEDGLAAGDHVELTVSDTGEGMSEDVLARAMDPFFTTKRVGQGSGMGLAQVYGFARQSGGTLRLASRPGEGTTATLLLPRAVVDLSAPQDVAAPGTDAHARGRVLLVEDDDLVRDTVSAALRAAGFEIHAAPSGDAAMARLDAGERYDAVLTDIVMPGKLNGLDLARHVRERHPGTGIVVATGYTDQPLGLPGVLTLPKPYGLQQAVEALNRALNR